MIFLDSDVNVDEHSCDDGHLDLGRRMMHTYTGTFLLMFLVIFGAGVSYVMCAG